MEEPWRRPLLGSNTEQAQLGTSTEPLHQPLPTAFPDPHPMFQAHLNWMVKTPHSLKYEAPGQKEVLLNRGLCYKSRCFSFLHFYHEDAFVVVIVVVVFCLSQESGVHRSMPPPAQTETCYMDLCDLVSSLHLGSRGSTWNDFPSGHSV